MAVAETLLRGGDYASSLKDWYRRYPNAGYGWRFIRWGRSADSRPYQSWGNGSAMRVSPVGFGIDTLERVLAEAKRSAEATHDHPDAVQGAQATAAVIFLARTGKGREEIREYVRSTFGYPLDQTVDEIRPGYRFDPSCRGTVPPAITAFLESSDFEDAVRKAVSLGGDSDTLACITGGMAHAFYGGVPELVRERVFDLLDGPMSAVVREFGERHGCF